jgi:hypothetical protein
MVPGQVYGVSVQDMAQVIKDIGVPGVLAIWVYFEKRDNIRKQKVIESFLPFIRGTTKAMKNVNSVVGDDDD